MNSGMAPSSANPAAHQHATRDDRPPPAEGVGKHTGRNLEEEDRDLERRPQQHQPQWVEMHDLYPVDGRHGGPQREEQRERPPDTEVDRIGSQVVHSRPAFSIARLFSRRRVHFSDGAPIPSTARWPRDWKLLRYARAYDTASLRSSCSVSRRLAKR